MRIKPKHDTQSPQKKVGRARRQPCEITPLVKALKRVQTSVTQHMQRLQSSPDLPPAAPPNNNDYVDLISSGQRIVAVILHRHCSAERLKVIRAIGQGELEGFPLLAKKWGVWGLMAVRPWAEMMAHAPIPTDGIRIKFITLD
jgi:hypothetical protein